jgi:hypothetical protein
MFVHRLNRDVLVLAACRLLRELLFPATAEDPQHALADHSTRGERVSNIKRVRSSNDYFGNLTRRDRSIV